MSDRGEDFEEFCERQLVRIVNRDRGRTVLCKEPPAWRKRKAVVARRKALSLALEEMACEVKIGTICVGSSMGRRKADLDGWRGVR